MNPTFENIRYKNTSCVILTQDGMSESSIRKVKISHELWTRKRPVKGKRCLFANMNLNVYVLKEATEKNQFNNELASRIMGFIIIGPAILFSTNGFHLSLENIEKIESESTQKSEQVTFVDNAFAALSCSDDEEFPPLSDDSE